MHNLPIIISNIATATATFFFDSKAQSREDTQNQEVSHTPNNEDDCSNEAISFIPPDQDDLLDKAKLLLLGLSKNPEFHISFKQENCEKEEFRIFFRYLRNVKNRLEYFDKLFEPISPTDKDFIFDLAREIVSRNDYRFFKITYKKLLAKFYKKSQKSLHRNISQDIPGNKKDDEFVDFKESKQQKTLLHFLVENVKTLTEDNKKDFEKFVGLFKACLNQLDCNKKTPIHYVIDQGDHEKLKLIQEYCDQDVWSKSFADPDKNYFRYAIKSGYLEMVKILYSSHSSFFSEQSSTINQSISLAINENQPLILEYLLSLTSFESSTEYFRQLITKSDKVLIHIFFTELFKKFSLSYRLTDQQGDQFIPQLQFLNDILTDLKGNQDKFEVVIKVLDLMLSSQIDLDRLSSRDSQGHTITFFAKCFSSCEADFNKKIQLIKTFAKYQAILWQDLTEEQREQIEQQKTPLKRSMFSRTNCFGRLDDNRLNFQKIFIELEESKYKEHKDLIKKQSLEAKKTIDLLKTFCAFESELKSTISADQSLSIDQQRQVSELALIFKTIALLVNNQDDQSQDKIDQQLLLDTLIQSRIYQSSKTKDNYLVLKILFDLKKNKLDLNKFQFLASKNDQAIIKLTKEIIKEKTKIEQQQVSSNQYDIDQGIIKKLNKKIDKITSDESSIVNQDQINQVKLGINSSSELARKSQPIIKILQAINQQTTPIQDHPLDSIKQIISDLNVVNSTQRISSMPRQSLEISESKADQDDRQEQQKPGCFAFLKYFSPLKSKCFSRTSKSQHALV